MWSYGVSQNVREGAETPLYDTENPDHKRAGKEKFLGREEKR
jgi:hypothetical protein